jgi:hypothetical protein
MGYTGYTDRPYSLHSVQTRRDKKGRPYLWMYMLLELFRSVRLSPFSLLPLKSIGILIASKEQFLLLCKHRRSGILVENN